MSSGLRMVTHTVEHDAGLEQAVSEYIQLLHSGDFDSAFHGLIDLDPEIVHPLIAAYHGETSQDIRAAILRIIREFRTPFALPLLNQVLHERRDNRWRGAVDGLVTLASAEAIQTLERALKEESVAPNPDSDYLDWVREALDQTREAHAAKSSRTGHSRSP